MVFLYLFTTPGHGHGHIYTLSFDNLEISRVCKKNLDIGIISLQNRVLDTKTWFLGKTRLTIKINIKNHLP